MSNTNSSSAHTQTAEHQSTSRRYLRREVLLDEAWWPNGWLPLLGLLGTFLWGLFVTAPSIEESTQDQVAHALTAAGYPDLKVEASGQEVLVQGTLETGETRAFREQRVSHIARGAECDDGWIWNDLVCPTEVDVSLASVSPATASLSTSPAIKATATAIGVNTIAESRTHNFQFRRTSEGRLLLDGEVPSESARSKILETAQQRFPNAAIEDQLRVSDDQAGPHDPWAIERAWQVLDALKTGGISWNSGRLSAWGRLPRADLDDAQASFRESVPGDRFGSLDLQAIEDVARCNQEFSDALAESAIQFKTGSTSISTESRSFLNRLAELAQGCPVALRIEGHTDSVGSEAANMTLSRERAEAVLVALVQSGADGDRLIARGIGPLQPIASNDTAEGRAQNRRIEIMAAELTSTNGE